MSHPPKHPVINGFKTCLRCEVNKPVADFTKTKWGPGPDCKACKAAYNKALPTSDTIVERFERNLIRKGPDECWGWSGSHNVMKRPTLYVGGTLRMALAYRVAWELAGNTLPEWPMVIHHVCENGSCTNVAHMRVVRQQDNTGVLCQRTPHWKNAQKTHCVRGHEFTPENTYRPPGSPDSHRNCRACIKLRSQGLITARDWA